VNDAPSPTVPGSRSFSVRLLSPAPPHTVYRILADATLWKYWAGPLVTSSEWESEPDATGAGGIRRLGRPPYMVREEITAAEPPHHHGYRMLSGQPVRSYQADVFISGVGDPKASGTGRGSGTGASQGSEIEWSGTVVALVPGTGAVMHFLFGRMVKGFARRLAAVAAVAHHEP
jgi:hypothetical protein